MKFRILTLTSAFAVCSISASLLQAGANSPGSDSPEKRLAIARGSLNVAFDVQAMKDLGISFDGVTSDTGTVNMMLQIDAGASSFQLSRRDGQNEGFFGMLSTSGGLTWNVSSQGRTEKTNVGDLLLGFGGLYASISDSRDLHVEILQIVPETVKVDYDPEFSHLLITAEVKVAEQLMLSVFGTEHGIGNTVGKITIEGVTEPTNSTSEIEFGGVRAAGPDVTVGELRGSSGDVPTGAPTTWGTAGGYVGYSAGTTSCNVGTTPLNWFDGQNNHPVIGQSLYRYSVVNGASRIEQVGQSWLKHGFCALQGTVCLSCTPFCGSCCNHLGVGCSDPYNASRNGTRSGMGAKGPVNPATGVNDYGSSGLSYPSATAPSDDVTTGRLRVLQSDVNPALNSGALYYYEGQYVAADDAAAGNKNNNASYRRCTVGASPNFTMSWASTAAGQTVRQTQAIKAWKVNDAAVNYVDVDVPNDGRFTLGYRVTDLSGIGNGPWHYEYAMHNMNSDRSASSFSVPVDGSVAVSNTGFRDVDYYKDGVTYGTAYDGTDWPVTIHGGTVSWDMVPASPVENSNALRWGTMYNYRFDANSAPMTGDITLVLFKAGSPTSVTFTVQVPSPLTTPCACPGDLNASLTVDGDDIPIFTSMYMGQTAVSNCADLAAPNGGALDDSDVSAFSDLLVNGTNVCK